TSGGSVSNLSASAETINLQVTLSAGQHIIATAGGSGPLTLTNLNRNVGATAVFVTGGGNISLTNSPLATNNNILGGWATVAGNWATYDANSNIIALPAASYLNVNAGGTIASNPLVNLRITNSGGNVTLAAAGTTDINSL